MNTEKNVTIKLPLTRNMKDDVYVCINGKSWAIQRGKDVTIPWNVYRVLDRQEKMLSRAMEFEEQAKAPLKKLEGE